MDMQKIFFELLWTSYFLFCLLGSRLGPGRDFSTAIKAD